MCTFLALVRDPVLSSTTSIPNSVYGNQMCVCVCACRCKSIMMSLRVLEFLGGWFLMVVVHSLEREEGRLV